MSRQEVTFQEAWRIAADLLRQVQPSIHRAQPRGAAARKMPSWQLSTPCPGGRTTGGLPPTEAGPFLDEAAAVQDQRSPGGRPVRRGHDGPPTHR